MTLPMLDRAVRVGRRAQIAQLMGTHDSKTDQTAQTDQRIETAGEFGAPRERELTSPDPELTSATAQRLQPGVQVAGILTDSDLARPSPGAPLP